MSEFSRLCTNCGKIHDTGLQDMKTGEMIHRIDLCIDCWGKNAFSFNPIYEQINLNDCSHLISEDLKKAIRMLEKRMLEMD